MASQAQNTPSRIGRYEIIGLLATGGMAEVFLGKVAGPSGFSRPVVIKRILPHLIREKAFVDMFIDEARIAARISHPNVVQVHELGGDEAEPHIVMEYLEGEPLSSLLRNLHKAGERMPTLLASHIISQVCAGLHAAHELKDASGRWLGVVHRDVSPQNVFITYDGAVKVLDFGVAKAVDRIQLTDAGQLKGKFEYMSPEQTTGQPADRRSDIFASGILLWESLTNRRLFKRDNKLAVLAAVQRLEVEPIRKYVPNVAPELEAACMKALAREPTDRYQTAAEFRRDLTQVIAAAAPGPLDEHLTALMTRLFSDRIAEKREMLKKLETGTGTVALAAPQDGNSFEPSSQNSAIPKPVSLLPTPPPSVRAELVDAATVPPPAKAPRVAPEPPAPPFAIGDLATLPATRRASVEHTLDPGLDDAPVPALQQVGPATSNHLRRPPAAILQGKQAGSSGSKTPATKPVTASAPAVPPIIHAGDRPLTDDVFKFDSRSELTNSRAMPELERVAPPAPRGDNISVFSNPVKGRAVRVDSEKEKGIPVGAIVGAVALLVLCIAGLLAYLFRPTEEIADAPPPSPSPSAIATPAVSPSAAASAQAQAPVQLRVESTPAGALVTVDGSFKGRTPLVIYVQPGPRLVDVEIEHAGYESQRELWRPAHDDVLRVILRRSGRGR